MWDLVAAQLAVMRAQVGGLQAQIDVLAAIVEEQTSVAQTVRTCPHLDTEDDGSTLAERRRRCLACGEVLVTKTSTNA
jgi:prefoldin subunit 5